MFVFQTIPSLVGSCGAGWVEWEAAPPCHNPCPLETMGRDISPSLSPVLESCQSLQELMCLRSAYDEDAGSRVQDDDAATSM